MGKYEVELKIQTEHKVKVIVEGDYHDSDDPTIDENAIQEANMDHGKWDYVDTDFDVVAIKKV
ncbi:hypothetical protein [Salibacterium aidingense]|uniref:hypothetical protein n=1 Tax=Salibacterium aidingense TaxID=384933 RepID=UPI000420604E|nr:hypothetical protein [Salibacterium aidingense]